MPPESRNDASRGSLQPQEACDTCKQQAIMQEAPKPSTFTCSIASAKFCLANLRPCSPKKTLLKNKQHTHLQLNTSSHAHSPVILYTKLFFILAAITLIRAGISLCKPLSASSYSTTVLGGSATSASTASSEPSVNQPVAAQVNLVAPTIDYSHNMRILKLPRSTQVGSLIYRLKGSDADSNTQLVFGVSGIEGRALLEVEPTPKSWNEADVYLRASLANAEQTIYNLTVWVSDGNKTTQVDSTVYVTEDSGESSLTPWVNARHVFHVPENAQPEETIGALTVLESLTSELPVRFELRGKGAEKFALKYVFGPTRGQSRAELVLAQPLDYERQNLFSLKALALNARTDTRLDTRNVATLDLVITVGDVQDTPPRFRALPSALKLANTLEAGAIIGKVEAEDGDFADQRTVGYALDASSPLASYFDIDKTSGEIKLTKSVAELALHSSGTLEWTTLSVFASELPDAATFDRLWPPMVARAELPLQLVDVLNEPPVFLGGWQSRATPSTQQLGAAQQPTRLLHGYLGELAAGSAAGLVRWHTNSTQSGWPTLDKLLETTQGKPIVLDLGLGSNGTFELSLEGQDARLFELEPALPVVKQSGFTLSVRPQVLENAEDRALFDREAAPPARHQFNLDIVARDFGTPQRLSSRISCLIELLDADDNAPHFDANLYTFSVYENAPPGQVLGQVRARDPDSGEAGRVRYTSLTGMDNQLFRLHPESGQLTLEGHLDREKKNLYLLLGEARDLAGSGKANYTQIQVQVLDVNDNAPQFTQPHYEAVLAPDGSFHAPLVVRAVDADEPLTANSQVAYEIIAGNQNDLFAIDAHSGAIYPSGGATGESHKGTNQIPSILSEPIVPYSNAPDSSATPGAGKILPEPPSGAHSAAHEVEESTYPTLGQARGLPLANHSSESYSRARFAWPRSSGAGFPEQQPAPEKNATGHAHSNYTSSGRVIASGAQLPRLDAEQLPALDLLLQLESEQLPAAAGEAANSQPHRRSLLPATSFTSLQSIRAPPLTTLIVRAHDFGIPLRSSTVKVNIHNQAMQSRSLSVILNGTAEALEQRREAIERAFSSMTGSRAQIESIEALSESSGISVARVKLAVPQHSLVDLTDLSALISAIDYRQPSGGAAHWPGSEAGRGGPAHTIAHYNPGADQLGGGGAGGQHQSPSLAANNLTSGRHIYGDIYSHPLEPTLSSDGPLERRLLIYIIIVAVCILALLVVWMVYTCSREDQIKIIEKAPEQPAKGNYRQSASEQNSANVRSQATNTNRTFAKTVAPSGEGDENELGGSSKKSQQEGLRANSSFNELLLPPGQLKPDHYSMYNGQVWFEPAGEFHQVAGRPVARPAMLLAGANHKRRASSAPSTGGLSLDSALHSAIQGGHADAAYDGRRLAGSVTPRNASGQFFPNTLGYMENLAALAQADEERYALYKQPGGVRTMLGRRQRGRKVAPLSDEQQPPSKPPRNAHLNSTAAHTNHAYSDDDDDEEETEERRAARKERRHSQTQNGRCAQQSDAKRRPSGVRRRGSDDEEEEGSGGSTRTGSSLEVSVVLDSDQELLGFDSTGTPIIATHTRANANKSSSLLLDMLEPQAANAALLVDANALASQRLLAAGNQQATLQRQSKVAPGARQQPTTRVTLATRKSPAAASSESANAIEGVQVREEAPSGGAREQLAAATKKASWASSDEPSKKRQEGVAGASASNSSEQSKQESIKTQVSAKEAREKELSATASRASSSGGSSQRKLKGDELRKANSQADLMGELSAKLNTRRQLSVDEAGRAKVGETKRSSTGELSAGAASEAASTTDALEHLRDMKNGELLEKQSIFALTYSGLNTQKLPA